MELFCQIVEYVSRRSGRWDLFEDEFLLNANDRFVVEIIF